MKEANVCFNDKDLELIKLQVKRGAEMGIIRCKEITKALIDIQSLSCKVGWYHISADDDWAYVECSECGNDIPELGRSSAEEIDMVDNAIRFTFPNYCSHCGAKMGVALTPSEYYTYLRNQGCEKGEERMDKFLGKVYLAMARAKFEAVSGEDELDTIKAFEKFKPFIYFDLDGDKVIL